MTAVYHLYGVPFSFYTGKVRAYLTYKQIPYEEVFSSLKVYKTIIVPNTGVRFIPVVKTPDDQYLQDTAVIIDALEQVHTNRPILPDTPKQRLVSKLFEIWADEWLLIPAMHYRWNKDNFPLIYQEFGRIVLPNMPAFIRAIVGKRIGAKFKGFVPLQGITEKSIPAIEDWYENHVLALLDQHFAEHDYLLGGAASLGDFCLMGPLYAHMYRDPAPGQLMRNKAPNVASWVERMNRTTDQVGEWLEGDQIPNRLIEILKRMFKEFWPVLTNTADELASWVGSHPSDPQIPRRIGHHPFTIGNTTENRAIITFQVWKLQRVLDTYQSLQNEDKEQVDTFLQAVNGLEAMQFKIKQRVQLENNKLVIA